MHCPDSVHFMGVVVRLHRAAAGQGWVGLPLEDPAWSGWGQPGVRLEVSGRLGGNFGFFFASLQQSPRPLGFCCL